MKSRRQKKRNGKGDGDKDFSVEDNVKETGSAMSSTSTRENEANIKLKAKNRSYGPDAFSTRCSPSQLKAICDKLTEQQSELVVDMGFGALFEYRCTQLDWVLCKELVDCFDVTQCMLYVKGTRIPVADVDVGRVFWFTKIWVCGSKGNDSRREKRGRSVVGLSKKGLKMVISSGSVDDLFRRAFLMCVLSVFFCSTTMNAPSPKLFPVVLDINNTALYNWSSFVLDWLVKEIKAYQKNRYSRHAIGGCTFFLMIWYFHRRPIGSMGLYVDTPLVKAWDNERVCARGRLERKDEEGLLYDRGEREEYSSMKANLKHEVTQYLYKRMMNVLKSLDDDLLVGKFNIGPFIYE